MSSLNNSFFAILHKRPHMTFYASTPLFLGSKKSAEARVHTAAVRQMNHNYPLSAQWLFQSVGKLQCKATEILVIHYKRETRSFPIKSSHAPAIAFFPPIILYW